MDRERQELESRYAETDYALSRLTKRQMAILNRVCAGAATKAIALELGISTRLVELERSRLLRAFNASGTAQIAVRVGEYRALRIVWRSPLQHSEENLRNNASREVVEFTNTDEELRETGSFARGHVHG